MPSGTARRPAEIPAAVPGGTEQPELRVNRTLHRSVPPVFGFCGENASSLEDLHSRSLMLTKCTASGPLGDH